MQNDAKLPLHQACSGVHERKKAGFWDIQPPKDTWTRPICLSAEPASLQCVHLWQGWMLALRKRSCVWCKYVNYDASSVIASCGDKRRSRGFCISPPGSKAAPHKSDWRTGLVNHQGLRLLCVLFYSTQVHGCFNF